MATKAFSSYDDGRWAWAAGTAADVGDALPAKFQRGAVGAVQMTGTFGGTVTMQKSNDGTNWVTMKDLDGADIALTAAGMAEFSTGAAFIRPSFGAGVVAVVVTATLQG